jgi:Ca2+:H+ antiporter
LSVSNLNPFNIFKSDQFPVYVAYLAFQLYSHTGLYEDKGEHNVKTTAYDKPKFRLTTVRRRFAERDLEKSKQAEQVAGPSLTDGDQTLSPGGVVTLPVEEPQTTEEEEEEQPQLSVMMSLGLLVAVTVVYLNFRILHPFDLITIFWSWWL